MSFTFHSYQPQSMDEYPLNNAIGKLLAGYKGASEAKYLQPQMQAELEKAKLFNQYYGPEKESEMGLRTAQTEGQNLTNQYYPSNMKSQQDLRNAQIEEQKALAGVHGINTEQAKIFNEMLRNRLGQGTGGAQGAQMISPDKSSGEQYHSMPKVIPPGLMSIPSINQAVNAPDFETNPAYAPLRNKFKQLGWNPKDLIAQQQTNSPFSQEPQMTNDDIVNKKFFNTDTFTPKYKAWVDAQTAGMKTREAEKFKLEAKQNFEQFKHVEGAKADIPVLEDKLASAMRLKEIVKNHPEFFGHTYMPGYFAKTANDKLVGEFTSNLVPQIAGMEKQLSDKGNQLALKIASDKVPGFGDSHQIALGKAETLVDLIQRQLQRNRNIAGGNIKTIGGKRFKMVDGEWHELEKGEF